MRNGDFPYKVSVRHSEILMDNKDNFTYTYTHTYLPYLFSLLSAVPICGRRTINLSSIYQQANNNRNKRGCLEGY